jgi:hypothetical protein
MLAFGYTHPRTGVDVEIRQAVRVPRISPSISGSAAPGADLLGRDAEQDAAASSIAVQMGYMRRYRDWSIANRPKAMNPSATAVSRSLPNGCARIVCSAPSSPCAFSRSKVSAA